MLFLYNLIKNRKNSSTFLGLVLLVGLFLGSCQNKPKKEQLVGKVDKEQHADLAEIIKKDKLVVLAENSANSYFIYRGTKMGLEYEILKEFAKELGVSLEIKIVKDLDEIKDLLNDGVGDIIACNYTVTKDRLREIAFSTPIMRTAQVLIQRKPDDYKERKKRDWKSDLITEPDDLSRKEVHVWKNSSYYNRLINLQGELGDTIYLKEIDGDVIPEEVIKMVSEGFIDYTVTDQNVAMIHQRFYPNIDAHLELSVKQKIAFGLRKSSTILKNRLDNWLNDFMKTTTFRYIKHKYLKLSKYSTRANNKYSSIKGGKISPYDPIIKTVAEEYNWDWRFIAALIYQESKFIDNQESWAGAYGLMQFMPSVGPSYGVFRDSPAEVQIRGGIKKISKNHGQWSEIPDSIQQIKFTIASYNAGTGHVQDAQRLAKKHGKDPLVWDDNVEQMILNLSKPKYYQDEVVKYGYLRGHETYNYVRDIFIRHNEYMNAFP